VLVSVTLAAHPSYMRESRIRDLQVSPAGSEATGGGTPGYPKAIEIYGVVTDSGRVWAAYPRASRAVVERRIRFAPNRAGEAVVTGGIIEDPP
jgi:hypothetical protein